MGDTDVVASWSVPLQTKVIMIEFEHGTISSKRVIRVDGKEVLRRDWKFKLVGKEFFNVGDIKCCISVDASGNIGYEYSLEVNGKTFEKFKEEQNQKLRSWEVKLGEHEWRVVLDKDSMDVWANGNNISTTGEFVDDGVKTHFELGKTPCYILAYSSGNRKQGIIHDLYIHEKKVPSTTEGLSTGGPLTSTG